MSKRRKQTTNASDGHVMPGFTRGNWIEVMDVIDDAQLGRHDFPPKINAAIQAFAFDAKRFALRDRKALRTLDHEQQLDFGAMLLYAAHMGFAMALYRYADVLRHVPELSRWREYRLLAGDRGRESQQREKAARIARIHAMLNNGMEPVAIAADLKCSLATVYRALKPATSKPSKTPKKTRRR